MRSAKDLQGIAIVDVSNGKRLGTADEIVVSPDDRRVLGLVMKGGLLGQDTLIEIADVRSIGSDAITVEGDEVAHTEESVAAELRDARASGRTLVGRKVVTQEGTLVGTISDYLIDEGERRVAAIHVGGGLLERSDALPADRIVSVGPDVVVVSGGGAQTTTGKPSTDSR